MIPVSSTYNTIVENLGSYEWQVLNGSNTWGPANMIDGTLSSTLFETVSVGNTIASQLDLTLIDVTPDTSSPLVLQFRATDGTTTSSWYTKGTYYIDTVETSPYSEQTKISAFDAMLKSEATYLLSGSWTAKTAHAVATEIATDMGIDLDGDTNGYMTDNPITLTNAPSMGENGTTDREMLSYIASLYGGNWRVSSENELILDILYTAPTYTALVGDAIVEFDASVAETITKVRVSTGETSYYAPQVSLDDWNAIAGTPLEVSLPIYGSQDVALNLLSLFNGKVFYPYTGQSAYIDPKYEVGDGVTVKDVTSILASQSLSIDQLSPSEINFKGEEIVNSYYPYINPVQREIAREEKERKSSISVLESEITAEVTARQNADVSSVQTWYYLSTSNTTQTGGSWVTTIPSVTSGTYLWSKTVVTQNDGSTNETTPVLGENAIYQGVISNSARITVNENSITEEVATREELGETVIQLTTTVEQNNDNITQRVSSVENSVASKVDAAGVNNILSTKKYVTESTLTQTASSITASITSVQSEVTAQGNEIDELTTYYRLGSNEAIIGKSTSEITSHFSNNEWSMQNSSGTKLQWLNSSEGAGVSQLSIGDANTSSKRWKIQVSDDGNYLRFTRHS